MAGHTGARVLHVEDAFLRSVHTGREGDVPIGLCLDERGVHFDSSTPSDLETLLATHPLDDTALLDRARAGIDRMRHAHISKYNAFDPQTDLPEAPYVLVIDQTRGDASIAHGGANAATFREMLVFAQTEHPGSRIIIKAHPETVAGLRDGHFDAADQNRRISLLRGAVSPWRLFEGATAVYTVSSQLGFEAIFAGHKPRVFGQPFYAGWGLTQDETPVARRERPLSRAQLFAAAMILYPTWYDPMFDRLCSFEEALGALEARARAWREDRHGYIATGMRLWKRGHLQSFFGHQKRLLFRRNTPAARALAAKTGRRVMCWGASEAAEDSDTVHVEDGFWRSIGLGAQLARPLSLVADDLGLYYDPSRESRLERLIAAAHGLPQGCIARARALMQHRISKYRLLSSPLPALPEGRRILVVGQVEDDASVKLGCTAQVKSNLELLARTRAENPNAVLIYKPHPDVEAGLRAGALSQDTVLAHADMIAANASPQALIAAVDEIWTMTSLLGFEALMAGKPVVCLGTPFYAGWGLTRDMAPVPPQRVEAPRPGLEGLAHACLIDYPRYFDPFKGRPMAPEMAARLLSDHETYWPHPASKADKIRLLARGILASLPSGKPR